MQRRNVLIYHTGAIGDFILTFPLAMALGRLYAQSRIIYVTHSQKGKLAQRALGVESVDVEGGWHQLFNEQTKLPDRTTQLLNNAHSVIAFIKKTDETWIRNIRSTDARADLIPLEPRPASEYRGHVTDFWIEQLGPWPALQASVIAMVNLVRGCGIAASRSRGQTILVHPGSGSERKCWPAGRFLELIEMLHEKGLATRVILGEVELEKWPAERVRRFENVSEVVRPQTLLDLYEHLAQGAALVSNDSGPAHLSAMMGTPTVSLFGASSPTVWRPLGPRVEILHRDPIDAIEPADVRDVVMSMRANGSMRHRVSE